MNIAILGLGTVGSGACEAVKSAIDLEVTRILVRRPKPEYADLQTEDIDDILNDPNIDLVAECMGGIHPALEYVLGAMEHGKHVVTANKALVSAHFEELENCARKNGVQFRFTPSAGGGIPWLYNLQRAGRCDTIEEVHGIVNGTSCTPKDRISRKFSGTHRSWAMRRAIPGRISKAGIPSGNV